jgi:hypothetical protein
LIFLPMSITAMASNLLGGRITEKLGPKLPVPCRNSLWRSS